MGHEYAQATLKQPFKTAESPEFGTFLHIN